MELFAEAYHNTNDIEKRKHLSSMQLKSTMIYRRRIFRQILPQSLDHFLRIFNHVRSINKIHKSCVSSPTIVLNHLAVPLIELNSKQRFDPKDKYEQEKKIARLH